jgi:hypothetical protein
MTTLFNPFNIESVITAAVINNPKNFEKGMPISSSSVLDEGKSYASVLVGADAFAAIEKKNAVTAFVIEKNNHENNLVDDGLQFSMMRQIVNNNIADRFNQTTEDLQRLAMLLDYFYGRNKIIFHNESHKKSIDIIEDGLWMMAMLYDNYNEALNSLLTGKHFSIAARCDLDRYKSFVTSLKAKISAYLKIVYIEVGRKTYSVPIMNIASDQAVWAARLLQKRFSHGLLYEINGETIYAMSWSNDDIDPSLFKKTIRSSLKENYSVVFTG